ncbi:MAG: CRISPR-associated endonuclease Cas6 [Bacteroidota bacterium]|nr:CRISPR-associated endonuclease Cas6 [Bacteroidota bacterium]
MTIKQSIIQFPDIGLNTRDAHKIRGYFGNLFKEQSPLLHNHWDDGSLRYAYPMVQYKVIDGRPVLVGFEEGGDLLVSLFLKIKELIIDDRQYLVLAKNIHQKNIELTVNQQLYSYKFKTLWMGLNQKNFKLYQQITDEEKKGFLNRQVQNNILSFYKAFDFRVSDKIMVTAGLTEKQTKFKDKPMLAFSGSFTSNAFIPDYCGLGKSVSRGFGTVVMEH